MTTTTEKHDAPDKNDKLLTTKENIVEIIGTLSKRDTDRLIAFIRGLLKSRE